jgi:hypothetical protein
MGCAAFISTNAALSHFAFTPGAHHWSSKAAYSRFKPMPLRPDEARIIGVRIEASSGIWE